MVPGISSCETQSLSVQRDSTMRRNNIQGEPIGGSTAKFISEKQDVASTTRDRYEYRLGIFVEFCEKNGVWDTDEIDGDLLADYRAYRLNDDDTSIKTNEANLVTLRQWIKWLERRDKVYQGTAHKVDIPDLDASDERRDVFITHDRAEGILDNLTRYEFASKNHIIFGILYHTGMRRSALLALDVDDWISDDRVLMIRNREGTTLKLGDKSERNVTITDARLAEAIDDWVESQRPDVICDLGREPLISTREGRAHATTIQKTVYRVTCPGHFGSCDDDHQRNSSCRYSISPHDVRRSAITHHLRSGVPKEIVSDRMAVDSSTIEKHYDKRTMDQRRENREEYLNDI